MVVRIICSLLILFKFNIFTVKQIVSPIRLVHFAGYDYVIQENCRIAIEAREIYHDKCTKRSWEIVNTGKPSRHPVLFAASVGSFGAYLADGSEYREILANSVAHLIAFETTLNKLEAKACAELLDEEALDFQHGLLLLLKMESVW
ncbi:putative homocysteine S-methyltransferase [Rosa chinensis]|uniref:Putative homocysteine S-methyltransferase n=1 Tax=Rosa chinensis TaxID=74649 RepID=A0A2P6QPA4_ROSCH|nr:putative homocysteine S-methyltransferase [Rosa chinensis]